MIRLTSESSYPTWTCDHPGRNQYDEMYDPPRLVVKASVAPPTDITSAEANIQMELDTGADVTAIPAESVSDMHLPYGLVLIKDFSENVTAKPYPRVHLRSPSLRFERNVSVILTDAVCGLIGRDVLNDRILILNGPANCWCCPPHLCDSDDEQQHKSMEITKVEVVQ